MPIYLRFCRIAVLMDPPFEIWNCLSSYDIYGVSTANQLIDGVRELAAALADGRTADVDGESPVFQAFHRFERNNPDRE